MSGGLVTRGPKRLAEACEPYVATGADCEAEWDREFPQVPCPGQELCRESLGSVTSVHSVRMDQ